MVVAGGVERAWTITLVCTSSEHIMRCVHLQEYIHNDMFDHSSLEQIVDELKLKHVLKAHTAFTVH